MQWPQGMFLKGGSELSGTNKQERLGLNIPNNRKYLHQPLKLLMDAQVQWCVSS